LCVIRHGATLGSLPRRPLGWSIRSTSVLPFSTSVAKESAAKTTVARRWKWKFVARVAYYFRIPALVLSVYGFGYQQGIMDYSREPEYMESKLMETSLASVGCMGQDMDDVLVAREGGWRDMLSKFRSDRRLRDYDEMHHRMVMLHNAAGVGEKIVKAAQSYVKGRLNEAVREATERLPPEVVEDKNLLYEVLRQLDDVELWVKAQSNMEGPWRFVLVPSPVPNAFVSEVLPRRIFITTSFFETFIESQDELALVLGHEISHLILGHSSGRNSIETAVRTVEILLLSLDPTEGLLSLAFMALLASIRNAIGAVYSRENERCADELGIKLTAMACYDTRAASKVFHKMHVQNVESGRESSPFGLLSFFDSHPPSDERFRALLEESGEENREKYEETSCKTLKATFWDAMKPKPRGEK